ncbi:ATPase family associated with various cellular activities (AAA) [Chitinophaga sp. CF118]|uniref:AAA family ATPase n=1 Tax=Chitinophaga sp. CF118 TaxID=1884367 RepID=UPI0008DF760A|nr:AAA family ATPase [Chitinophaga sp. CF118]SFE26017.1 ATPase family associated with various cellular activities (AAA) [Chitinophaga sp. CF118]
MDNILQQKVISGDNIFGNGLLDSKAFYLYYFNALPNISFIYTINGEKALTAFKAAYADNIEAIYLREEIAHKDKEYKHDLALVVLKNGCIAEFGEDYCEMLHNGQVDAFIKEVTILVRKYRERQKRKQYEINLITMGEKGLVLKSMEFKKTKLDLALYYEDDFIAIDQLIYKRLNTNDDKGIVLLHGIPGSGKTTYLRYLIGRLKKRVLFLSPAVAGNIMQPDFIDLLIDNPNTILIIEDAENIIMDRKTTGNSSVSNLLNLSDGLLADCMNVQVVCTFNSDLSQVDSALLRKGRLIAKYEFGKLSVPKAQFLSGKQGFNTVIQHPMTIAEVMNQHEPSFEKQEIPIGFRAAVRS